MLSGDTAQLLSVDSGTPFALAQNRSALDTAIMKEIVRQNPELRPAIEAIIAGQVQTAIDTMNSVTPDVVPRRAGAKLPEQSVVDSGNKVITHILDDYRSRTPEAQKRHSLWCKRIAIKMLLTVVFMTFNRARAIARGKPYRY